ncbi:MAG: hypothetical protein ACRDLL_07720 [Solirubrobacterales bacterium]
MLVDSGADCSCFPLAFAETLGIDLNDCPETSVHTGNGLASHYCAREPLRALIAEREVLLTASFGPVGVPVLGRDDFFSEFLVEVDHPQRLVVLTPHELL